jgi:hypothetical protein
VLEKSGQHYRLEVPIHFDTGFDTTVVLNSPATSYSVTLSQNAQSISIDPDLHLFRRLYPVEIEPILSAVLGHKNKMFYTNDESSNFQTFGKNMTENNVTVNMLSEIGKTDSDHLPILLNPFEIPEYINDRIQIRESSITLDEKVYPIGDHTFILTGQDWNGFENVLIILSDDLESLPRIGQLVPHYGKYSYLVFKGTKNVGKGQWSVNHSPLVKNI